MVSCLSGVGLIPSRRRGFKLISQKKSTAVVSQDWGVCCTYCDKIFTFDMTQLRPCQNTGTDHVTLPQKNMKLGYSYDCYLLDAIS